MKSFSTVALASIAALVAADPSAIMYSNTDCTGETFEWHLHGRDEIRKDYYGYFVPMGWNDKGQSIQVPEGYTVRLSEHGMYQTGIKIDFVGQVNNDGTLVCQDLGDLRLKVSDSIFSDNRAREIADLRRLISDNTSALQSLNYDFYHSTNRVSELENEQVLEEHFYSNDEILVFTDWANNRDQCFDAFSVGAGHTLDFDANVSMAGVEAPDNKKARGRLFLVKNDTERVAQNWFATRSAWDHPGAAMTYREQLDDDATYKLCFTWQDQSNRAPQFNQNMFQWGYKIRGGDYNMNSHSFSASDLTQSEENPVWHY